MHRGSKFRARKWDSDRAPATDAFTGRGDEHERRFVPKTSKAVADPGPLLLYFWRTRRISPSRSFASASRSQRAGPAPEALNTECQLGDSSAENVLVLRNQEAKNLDMGRLTHGPIHLRTLASTIVSFVGKKLARAPRPPVAIDTSDRDALLSRIEQFQEHVEFGLQLIDEQRERLDRIRGRGLNADEAEAILIQLQAAQILYHECLDSLLDSLVRLNDSEAASEPIPRSDARHVHTHAGKSVRAQSD